MSLLQKRRPPDGFRSPGLAPCPLLWGDEMSMAGSGAAVLRGGRGDLSVPTKRDRPDLGQGGHARHAGGHALILCVADREMRAGGPRLYVCSAEKPALW